MAKYLVTGGAGFIGTNIVIELLAQGHIVRVLDNYSAGKKSERIRDGVEYMEGDIRNMEDCLRACDGMDGVFHLAAKPRVVYSVEHPLETHDNNINGTLNMLIAARDVGVKRLVFSTSSSVYGGDKGRVQLTEDIPKNPKSPYALHKLVGQEYCRLFSELYGLETVSLCYFNIYGPYLDPDGAYALVIGKFLKQLSEGRSMSICGDGEQVRDYTHVSDVVRANILAMTKDTVGAGEMINIGNNRPFSVNELAKLIGGPVEYVAPRPGDVQYSCADPSRARELLGWESTVKLEDGIMMLKKGFGL
jgi:nucleoside-diphosphate-sugar epimerase